MNKEQLTQEDCIKYSTIYRFEFVLNILVILEI